MKKRVAFPLNNLLKHRKNPPSNHYLEPQKQTFFATYLNGKKGSSQE